MKERIIWPRNIWLPNVLGRLTSLLLTLSLLTLYFYIVGNGQGFTDRTLLLLFTVENWVSALCAVLGVFSTLAFAAEIPLRRRLKLKNIILSISASLFSLFLLLLMSLIQTFMDGY